MIPLDTITGNEQNPQQTTNWLPVTLKRSFIARRNRLLANPTAILCNY